MDYVLCNNLMGSALSCWQLMVHLTDKFANDPKGGTSAAGWSTAFGPTIVVLVSGALVGIA
jgi:hypothetical protein